MYAVLADIILFIHLLFVMFVVGGGLLALRWPRAAAVHLPATIWGALVEFTGWICPLTPLENRLRLISGRPAYEESFVEHYLLPLLYPPALTMNTRIILGGFVVLINCGVYFAVWRRLRKCRKNTPQ